VLKHFASDSEDLDLVVPPPIWNSLRVTGEHLYDTPVM